ncbi:hypothetical protein CFK41_10910 [Brachybacterium ginsengisoli]|uniref:DUF6318 domain-containing protein n=1 Tax=Brachybacterium ginsengisoli TaxID=1331682 RepID=A0A291GYE1_9MICO|nr:DUF6318 family protein [Brachybacterium ginsengisoli]ATG55213.1 hypothetical protein CFK41_10910 [Brachybacterium ginsengisoli]
MHRRLLSAAATGALLLGLAACGETTEGPVTTPPPDLGVEAPSDGGGDSPTASDGGGESEEPTAEAPDIPAPDPADFAGMDEHTAEGAEQAFKYYIAVSMWAHQTGDDSVSNDLTSQNCDTCSSFMETFRELQDHNDTWGEFSLNDASLEAHKSENFDFEVAYDFTTTPHERPKDDFSGRVNVGELEYSTVGGMTWTEDHWKLEAISAEWGDDVLG